MAVFELMEKYGHEQVVFNYDPVSGLRAIIAIHDTTLGPALGGARMWPYRTEEEALIDVLRLSRGMTYKSAVMGLNLGGGKAVIIGDPRKDKSEELFRAFGKFIETLNGRYITAEDVGTNPDDMDTIRTQTRWVAGLRETSGNPSPATAFGVFRAMEAAVRYLWNLDSLKGLRVAVQGTGSVGAALVRRLVEAGATVVATDIYRDRLDEAVKLGARPCSPDEIYSQECDIFAPCALGGILNDDTIPRLKAKIICGAANNQLLEPYHAGVLAERGILYCPDFVVNGGGVTNVADEFKPGGYNRERAMASVSRIYDILLRVLERSRQKGIDTCRAAEELAEERIALALKQKKMYVGE